jgi:hypothetical protein
MLNIISKNDKKGKASESASKFKEKRACAASPYNEIYIPLSIYSICQGNVIALKNLETVSKPCSYNDILPIFLKHVTLINPTLYENG